MTAWWLAGLAVLGCAMGLTVNTIVDRVYAAEPVGRWTRAVAVLATASLLVLLGWRIGARFEFVPYAALAVVGVALALIDVAEQRLPNSLVLPLYPILFAMFGVLALVREDAVNFLRGLGGCVALGGFLLLLAVAFAGQLGAGDVKLGGVLGIAAGWASWSAVWTTAFVAVSLALAFQVGQRVWRRRHAAVAFGPFLLAGLFSAVALVGI
ncbi:prepilin peptidase [Amycolatopsis sp. NPDC059657]|uniref:prepilin peptidase n=1 Tax=Amycolatopsis sp. NPDC059657 TaxID=3346899 RepID=UPI00366E9879